MIRWHAKAGTLLRFAAGGLISAPIAIGVTALLHETFAVSEPLAAAGGLGTALVVNFFVLRHLVFASTLTPILRQLSMFLASSGVFRGFEYLGFLLLNVLLNVPYLIALVAVLGVSFILKFLVYDKLVFARVAAAGNTRKTARRGT